MQGSSEDPLYVPYPGALPFFGRHAGGPLLLWTVSRHISSLKGTALVREMIPAMMEGFTDLTPAEARALPLVAVEVAVALTFSCSGRDVADATGEKDVIWAVDQMRENVARWMDGGGEGRAKVGPLLKEFRDRVRDWVLAAYVPPLLPRISGGIPSRVAARAELLALMGMGGDTRTLIWKGRIPRTPASVPVPHWITLLVAAELEDVPVPPRLREWGEGMGKRGGNPVPKFVASQLLNGVEIWWAMPTWPKNPRILRKVRDGRGGWGEVMGEVKEILLHHRS